MSVKKDKTLAKVRTFAQDFTDHRPSGDTAAVSSATPTPEAEIKASAHKPAEKERLSPIESSTLTKEEPKKAPKPIPKIVVSSTEKKSAPIIPSFHELEKVAVPKPKKQPATITVKKRPARPISGEATIITSTKKSRNTTKRASIFMALQQWVASLFAKKPVSHKYQVPDANHRKGVVEKATTKTGAFFTADNETLREEILRRRRAEELAEERSPEYTDLEDLDITWTPRTEVGYDLLAGEKVQSAPPVQPAEPKVEPQTETVAPPIPTPPQPDLAAEPEPPHETPTAAESRWATYAQESNMTDAESSKTPAAAPAPEQVPPQTTAPTPSPEPNPYTLRAEPFAALRNLFSGSPESINTNGIALGLVAVLASIFIVVVVVQIIFSALTPDTDTLLVDQSRPLLTTYPVIDVTLQATTSSALISALANQGTITTNSEQEIRIMTPAGEEMPTKELIALMDLDLDPELTQAITTIRFVNLDGVQYALVFAVNDSITALGSMLQWETMMVNNLSEYLYITNPPTEPFAFIDGTVAGKDVRVLSDGVDEVLTYGFVTDEIILITKTSDSFTRLATQ